MIADRLRTLACLGIIVVSAASAPAQDFHVTTTVYDVRHTEPREVARSLTLFHAGKTYDFLHEVGELIVFEPSRDRFTLVNTSQRRATVVHVDEIQRMLQMARQTVADHLDALKGSEKDVSPAVIEQIVFQIDPKFEETISQKNGEPYIELTSKYFQYQVQCAAPPAPEHLEAYLHYADWICRLNYVLHPGPILPEQRLALDASLRKAKMIPVEVNLSATVVEPIRLRAQHRIYWALNDKDRELLRQWDALLARKDLKRVSVHEYQRSLSLSQASRRR